MLHRPSANSCEGHAKAPRAGPHPPRCLHANVIAETPQKAPSLRQKSPKPGVLQGSCQLGEGTDGRISGKISPADAQRSADLRGLALSSGASGEVLQLARAAAEGFHHVLVVRP